MAVSLGVSTIFGTWKVFNEHWLPPSFLLLVSSLPCNSEFQMWVLGMLNPELGQAGRDIILVIPFHPVFWFRPNSKETPDHPISFRLPHGQLCGPELRINSISPACLHRGGRRWWDAWDPHSDVNHETSMQMPFQVWSSHTCHSAFQSLSQS